MIIGTYAEEYQALLEEIEKTGANTYRLDNGEQGNVRVNLVLNTDYMPENKGTGDGSGPVTIILTEKAAAEIYSNYSYTDIMIQCNSKADEQTYAGIAAIFDDNEYAICGSYEIGMEKIITDTWAIIYIAALIVIATAVTAILNMMIIMKANMILRRKEHGIWRALGMPLKQLKQSISMEILLMLAVSYMISVVVSLPIQHYMLLAMEKNVNLPGIVTGSLEVGIVFILFVYLLVMTGLRFRQTNEIMADIRKE